MLGTAGHIDHGKTALVRALTGVDTDRLPEEKQRGITIELGFAPLDLGDARLGVVDVPGHERLVRTMAAGATGIDLVLLVVAADEGVMPQTREHLAVCELLGIERGVVALTKIDLADAETVELASEEVAGLLAGTPLEHAPRVRVSSTTGEGLDALRAALATVARDAEPRRARAGPTRLPIDRVFAMRGFGSVVTGTLVGGALAVGDAVVLHPSGRKARVRGLERHGERVERLASGTRCAANLQGIEVGEIERGEVLAKPDALAPTRLFDAQLRWLPVAPATEGIVSIELIAGTAERRARLAPIDPARLRPGSVGFARVHVEGRPLALLPGDRFVVRGFARTAHGGTTLGGGRVLDACPPRRRRSDAGLVRDLQRLTRGEARTDVIVRVERAGLAGLDEARLRRETGLDVTELEAVLRALGAEGGVVRGRGGLVLAAAALDDLAQRIVDALRRFHAREPLLPGMPLAALRGALPRYVRTEAVELAFERAQGEGTLSIDGDRARLVDHRVELGAEARRAADRLLESARRAGLEPPALKEWAEQLGQPLEATRDLLAHLERQGKLVQAPGELWFDAEAVAELRQRVVDHLGAKGAIETPAYKALIGTTRKHAVPLMELFDRERLTLRVGNRRVLRGAS